MSNPLRLPALNGLLLFALCAALFAGNANADPSARVGYLSDSRGQVSYSPSGENQWFDVVRNRPLIRGDRLWTDSNSRAEFQVGSSAVRIDANSSVEILDLNDNLMQLQLPQGTLSLSVRRQYRDQQIEIDTPLLALTIGGRGRYRVDVDPRHGDTTIVVWEGRSEVYGDNAHFSLRAGEAVRFYDSDLHDYDMYGLPREDDFDRYGLERDRRFQRSESLRYVDDDLAGYNDLDQYGNWRPVSGQGHAWFPTRVSADWAPYRDGHWVWQEPWGWTWIDNAPWGFAPSHYGRWIRVDLRWGWVPGPRQVRPVYAPALVAFIGGSGWSLSLSLGAGSSPIGWFPLAPREVYVPSYHVSRNYFTRVNVNNTVIQNTTITNVYNNYYSGGADNIDQIDYSHRYQEQAVTVVPRTVFVNAQPVHSAAMRIDRKAISTGETLRIAPIAPSTRSVIGSGKVAKAHPAPEVFGRPVVARNPPPPAEPPFSQRKDLLRKQPGRPLEPEVVESVPDSKPRKNIRVLGEQENAVDVRAAGSGRTEDSAQPQRLDRSVEPKRRPEPEDRQPAQQQEQPQRKADSERPAPQQQERPQRKADSERPAPQQQEQPQRKADSVRPAPQQQEQSQRKADSERPAPQQQERPQRKADSERPVPQQQEQPQRKADSERPAPQQQEQPQRKADRELSPTQLLERQQPKASSAQQKGEARQLRPSEPAGQNENRQQVPKSERQLKCEQEARRLQQDASHCDDLE
ncbi:DUF6600 domain-containing protein [Marinobacterium lutimaris]|uniref:FecR family protein n=1 Tax=Marinobacterium lutimaris TaxID=568106 RepID=A0A1H6DTW9_9GAMM|nr:DUF6600 domain-containing protein [Marinobacterium lutimaris]SEG88832.1 FecR family protein [Marinobacterium lutimaris]